MGRSQRHKGYIQYILSDGAHIPEELIHESQGQPQEQKYWPEGKGYPGWQEQKQASNKEVVPKTNITSGGDHG